MARLTASAVGRVFGRRSTAELAGASSTVPPYNCAVTLCTLGLVVMLLSADATALLKTCPPSAIESIAGVDGPP